MIAQHLPNGEHQIKGDLRMSNIALIIIQNTDFNTIDVQELEESLQHRKHHTYFIYSNSEELHQRFIQAVSKLSIYNTDKSLTYDDISDGEWGFSKILMFNQKSLAQAA